MDFVANHPGCREFHAVGEGHLRALKPFLEECLQRKDPKDGNSNGVAIVNLGGQFGLRFLGTSPDQVVAIRKIFDETIAQVVTVPQYEGNRLEEYQSGDLQPENAPVFNFTIIEELYIGVEFRHLGADNTIECALKILESFFGDEGVVDI